MAGGVYALTEGRISPTTFGFSQVDVVVLVMLAFGGIGTLTGPILGAVAFTVIDELLVDLGQLRLLVYGVIILALFLFLPRGVITTTRTLFRGRETSSKDT
ncbi:MAG TPA: hypothetical protein VE173_07900, partial [Longimicrobiales bacterium]|nr:hypothetical protein [Longimicrobiales bacterium]